MEIGLEKAAKHPLKSVKNFSEETGQSTQSIYYAAKNDLIDYTVIDGIKFIVKTVKTLAYTPRKDFNRPERKAVMET